MTDTAIRIREKVGYGFGDTACCLFWSTFSMFLLYFYSDVFGLPVAAAGTMLLVTRIWDTFFDPVIGMVADRTQTRWGKFRPYLLWGAVPFGILGVLTFTTPNFGTDGKLIYAYVTYTLMMMAYSAVNCPYSAMLGVMTIDSRERTVLASYRMVFAFVGGLIIQSLTNPLVDFFGRGDKAVGFQWTATAYAVLAIFLLVFSFLWTRERIQPISHAKSSFRSDLKDLARNRPCLILFMTSVLTGISYALRSGSIMYYFKYFVQNEKLAGTYMVVGSVFAMVGVMSAKWLALIGRKKAQILCAFLSTVVMAACYWVEPGQLIPMFVLHGLLSMLQSVGIPIGWSMWADSSDYSEWKSGRRATGLVFAVALMSGKMGWAVGGAFGGWILGWYGFQANVAQTAHVLTGLRFLMSFYPAAAVLFIAFIFLAYPLDEPRVKLIQQELEQRRKNAEGQPVAG